MWLEINNDGEIYSFLIFSNSDPELEPAGKFIRLYKNTNEDWIIESIGQYRGFPQDLADECFDLALSELHNRELSGATLSVDSRLNNWWSSWKSIHPELNWDGNKIIL